MKSEIKKLLSRFEIKLALIIGFALWIYQIIVIKPYLSDHEELMEHTPDVYSTFEAKTSFLQAWLGQDWITGAGDLFYLILFPVIAALPFSLSHFREKKLGYDKLIICQIGRKKYHIMKYVISFVSGGIVTSLPPLASLLYSMTLYPLVPIFANYQTTVMNGALWSEIYYTKPLLYVALYEIVCFIVGGSMAVLTLALTYFAESEFQMLLVPMMLNLVLPEIFNSMPGFWGEITFFIPYAYVMPMPMGLIREYNIILSILMINIISSLLYFSKVRRDTI